MRQGILRSIPSSAIDSVRDLGESLHLSVTHFFHL